MKPGVYNVTLTYPHPSPDSPMSHRVEVMADGTAVNDLSWVRGTALKVVHDPPRVWGIGFGNCRVVPCEEMGVQ